jgi:outer membrane protein
MRFGWSVSRVVLMTIACAWAAPVEAQPLSADRAVQIALRQNTQVIFAGADVLDARGGVYGAASGLLPRLSASLTRGASFTDNQPFEDFSVVGGQFITGSGISDIESYRTAPTLSGSWSVLNFASLSSFRAARTQLRATRMRQQATRQDVALATRRSFYDVVRWIRLADVATGAARLARDDERRVRALFEVGSVSKSDLLKAQVRTAQSELDSLTTHQAVTVQRIVLANQIGIREDELGEIDTVLAVEPREIDEPSLVAEAERARPDLAAAEAEVRASRSSVTAARFGRLPYLTVAGSVSFNPTFDQSITSTSIDSTGQRVTTVSGFGRESDREWSGQVAINWDFFDGLATDASIATAKAHLARAQETRDALRRNLVNDVHEALIAYREGIEQARVAGRAVESATENLNLTQQKYNVGSATILELIDAQVQLQRARSDAVSALASIRVAEAQIDRVRGRPE